MKSLAPLPSTTLLLEAPMAPLEGPRTPSEESR